MESGNKLTNSVNPLIPQMHQLLSVKNELLRIEVNRIIDFIADRKSIPALINLLDDNEFDIRWIATEGLIKIGRRSIIPLLKSLRDGHNTYFPCKAAHHILQCLLSRKEKRELEHLLFRLDNYPEQAEITPFEASNAIRTMFQCKNYPAT